MAETIWEIMGISLEEYAKLFAERAELIYELSKEESNG